MSTIYARNYKSFTKSITTTTIEVVAYDVNRSSLVLFNQGSAAVRIYFESQDTEYFEIASGTGMTFPVTPQNQIKAETASGTATLTVMEA